jgi:hypothetical protein
MASRKSGGSASIQQQQGLFDEDESGAPIIIKRWSQHGIR